jgi:uncharacterized protein (TIGR02271 family)
MNDPLFLRISELLTSRVYSTNESVISLWEELIMLRHQSDHEPTVIGLFSDSNDARRALNGLREHHFSNDEVNVAFRGATPSPAGSESSHWFGQLRDIYQNRSEDTPSARPTHFEAMLAQLDLSRQDAAILDRELRDGAIVTVDAGERNQEARALLEQAGARTFRGRSERWQSPAAAAREPTVTSTPFTPPREADPGHIQLFGEELRVRKEKVSSGEVHVRKEAVTHTETVEVPVTQEHLVVEHTDGSGRIDAEGAIRVPLSEERLHIDKDTVLREEYKVGKREITQSQPVSDNVRRERLLIDDAEAQSGARNK